jgi:type IV secretory pathway VirB6-like protein
MAVRISGQACLATILPLFSQVKFASGGFMPAPQGALLKDNTMRKIVLVAAIAGAALSLAACSESTEDAAGEAADSAMADTEANVEAVGDAAGDAAAEAGAAVDAAGDEAAEAGAEVEADAQDETEAEAAAD